MPAQSSLGSRSVAEQPGAGLPLAAPPAAVLRFGRLETRRDVRAQLEAQYARAPPPRLSEATLRADTELELLRRSCFAQRNAQWAHATPEQFEFRPAPSERWTPQPPKHLLQLRAHGALDGRELLAPDGREPGDVEFVRERPWPPAEFALKPVSKPARRGGKRKAAPMAAVLDPVPLLAKTCRECRTQSSALWRTQTRTLKVKRPAGAAPGLADAFIAGMAKMDGQTKMEEVEQQVLVDLCMHCYLKLNRPDLFDKKRLEKKRQERRKKDQTAAAALQERKRLKHQIHALKKQQKEHRKQEMLAHQAGEAEEQETPPAAVILKFTREEIEAATGSSKERKKDRKHSRKDKKKKKKHRRKHEMLDDSESDGPTPIPSPAQMNGYVYADRAPEPYTTPQTSAFAAEHVADTESEALDSGLDGYGEEMASTPARSSSRKRKNVQYTEPPVLVESPASASKKRKTSSRSKRAATTAPAPVAAPAMVVVPQVVVKKRARTKKELARERELRALGQYCPVCSEVYEDDDPSTFVCCDSCELWVHGACDPSLTPELIAAMANTEDKYICPLCGGR